MKRRFLLYFMVLATAVLFAGFTQAQSTNGAQIPPGTVQPRFVAGLNSMQVVPVNYSTAKGNCQVSIYNPVYLDLNCEYSGLSGRLTNADIRMASAGQNGFGICQYKELSGTMEATGTFNMRCGLPYGLPFHPELLLKKKLYVELQTPDYPQGEIRGQIKIVTLDSDVDGDARMDAFIYRPSDTYSYTLCSLYDMVMTHKFDGNPTDSDPFLADFDGDGIGDHSFVRADSENGTLTTVYVQSKDNVAREIQWGNANLGDQPVFGDYDRDGKTDIAVYRSSDGIWYIWQSSDNQPHYEYWGLPDSDRACPGDYDKDGITDLCVARPENGQLTWYIRHSRDNQLYKTIWGVPTDIILPNNPVDVDGDGANDILVMRHEPGLHDENPQRVFYALRSSDNSWFVLKWGLEYDGLRTGDFDGDGRTDFAALRTIDKQLVWYIYQSSDAQTRIIYWGLVEDK